MLTKKYYHFSENNEITYHDGKKKRRQKNRDENRRNQYKNRHNDEDKNGLENANDNPTFGSSYFVNSKAFSFRINLFVHFVAIAVVAFCLI